MKNILILGAGQSAPYLISFMLKEAEKNNWFVTVCDRDANLAKSRVNGNPHGDAVEFDVNDSKMRQRYIKNADVVLNLLAPAFQYMVAVDCLHYGKHCITASYEDQQIRELDSDAKRKGILILNEMGLDPGIDHMSAMSIINKIRKDGGYITGVLSYGGGLPAPEVKSNPLDYCVTWNPRNVIMAGESGCQYMENGNIKLVSHSRIFQRTWPVEIAGVGTLEAYPNRDSLIYINIFNLQKVKTMIRGTLRFPGWSETWRQIIRLGLPNEDMRIPELNKMSYKEFTQLFLPLSADGNSMEARVANFLSINPTGTIIQKFKWLGLFDDRKIRGNPTTAAEVMTDLVREKMPLPDGERDMVILQHEIDAVFEKENVAKKKRIISTLIEYGEPNGFTAISKTVGLPAAIAATLILKNELPISGCHIPTHPAIYSVVLEEMKKYGIEFKETVVEYD